MSTALTWQTDCVNVDATLGLAKTIASNLRGGEVIELVSDLGGGKTAFVRGLAVGLGSDDGVRSPSFTINNVYETGRLPLHHYDFYRLDDPGIMRRELAETIDDPRAVVVIEWAEIVEDTLPFDTIRLEITVTGETSRHVTMHYGTNTSYVLEGLQ